MDENNFSTCWEVPGKLKNLSWGVQGGVAGSRGGTQCKDTAKKTRVGSAPPCPLSLLAQSPLLAFNCTD